MFGINTNHPRILIFYPHIISNKNVYIDSYRETIGVDTVYSTVQSQPTPYVVTGGFRLVTRAWQTGYNQSVNWVAFE